MTAEPSTVTSWRSVVEAYASAADTGDLDGLLRSFVSDATVVFCTTTDTVELQGADEIGAFLRSELERLPSMHHEIVGFDAVDCCSSITRCRATWSTRSGRTIAVDLVYRDTWTRSAMGWKIRERTMEQLS